MPIATARPRRIKPEQVLTWFGIDITETNKAVCPFHDETEPSLQVNKDYVYCYGCKTNLDTPALAKALFELQGKNKSYKEIFTWLENTDFPESNLKYKKSEYLGPVPVQLIDYWHNALYSYDKVKQLKQERLLTEDTIKQFKLGYRPDHNAWVIPYLYAGKADIVQFRPLDRSSYRDKYYGMSGHNRGAVMNYDLLLTPQPYVIILMGAFDGILAQQDGLLAVSINGSFPFHKKDKERVQQMFSLQKKKFIVPDNTLSEYGPAEKLAEWIDGEVCYFPKELPEGTDYIDYRKLGYPVQDFKRDVLCIHIHPNLIENLVSFYRVKDPFNLAGFHLAWYNSFCNEVADSLIQYLPSEKDRLSQVRTEHQLLNIIRNPKESW